MPDELETATRAQARAVSIASDQELSVQPVAELDDLRGPWTELAERAGNVFATWEWASAWWGEARRGLTLRLGACRDEDGSVVGILPLCLAPKRPLRTLRFIGHGPADQLGPICAPPDRPAVTRALLRAVTDGPEQADVLLAERMVAQESWSALLGDAPLRIEPSPVLRIDGRSWDELLAARSSNFRQQVRRRERRLAREYGLRFRLADDPRTLLEDLELLFDLHDRRWAGRSQAFSPARRRFHRTFAPQALERGWLRLWLAEVAGRPVAAWYGFRFAGVEWYYQAGRDPAWDHASVGSVLLAHTMREACGEGVREYRLLLGDEPYKSRFADEESRLETVARPLNRTGEVALRANAAASRLPGRAGRATGWLIDRSAAL